MINAEFDQETPYINSGPLTDDYIFSQIHFHWGENNTTGSGHAVSGVRYLYLYVKFDIVSDHVEYVNCKHVVTFNIIVLYFN